MPFAANAAWIIADRTIAEKEFIAMNKDPLRNLFDQTKFYPRAISRRFPRNFRSTFMNGVIYLVGLVVVVMAVLSLLGMR